mmetsp:Transcript_120189/g.311950  ORF Transcript_120189/g.311950 Transcript_120189/m.311950 type:complete len:259 (-) Transcript_120189:358-1134(-)
MCICPIELCTVMFTSRTKAEPAELVLTLGAIEVLASAAIFDESPTTRASSHRWGTHVAVLHHEVVTSLQHVQLVAIVIHMLSALELLPDIGLELTPADARARIARGRPWWPTPQHVARHTIHVNHGIAAKALDRKLGRGELGPQESGHAISADGVWLPGAFLRHLPLKRHQREANAARLWHAGCALHLSITKAHADWAQPPPGHVLGSSNSHHVAKGRLHYCSGPALRRVQEHSVPNIEGRWGASARNAERTLRVPLP